MGLQDTEGFVGAPRGEAAGRPLGGIPGTGLVTLVLCGARRRMLGA